MINWWPGKARRGDK